MLNFMKNMNCKNISIVMTADSVDADALKSLKDKAERSGYDLKYTYTVADSGATVNISARKETKA